MAKPSNGPASLSEAIETLESKSYSKAQDIRENLEKDYEEVRKALEQVKPYLNKVKAEVEKEVRESKDRAELTIKENPWWAVGIVGLVAFIIGWILGTSRK